MLCLSANKKVAACFQVLASKEGDGECFRGKKAAGDRLEDICLVWQFFHS